MLHGTCFTFSRKESREASGCRRQIQVQERRLKGKGKRLVMVDLILVGGIGFHFSCFRAAVLKMFLASGSLVLTVHPGAWWSELL